MVATDFSAASAFEGHIRIVHNAQEFLAACEHELSRDSSSPEIQENLDFARRNTWQHRVAQLSEIVRNSINTNPQQNNND
jgi:hypothetical protein